MDLKSLRFIEESIQAVFNEQPILEKKPGCPDGFVWGNKRFGIVERLGEWHDYRRRGRMARNMAPAHAAVAGNRGSWGVGKDYFRVRTDSGRIFDIYYDRAPQSSGQRKGNWFIYRELSE